jgi:hypothetical protein
MMKYSKLMAVCCASVILLGCATSPKEPIPPLRIEAQSNHQKALRAIRQGDLQAGLTNWQLAIRQYQALDDWAGQGAARLGLAQAQQKLALHQEAKTTLAPLLEQPAQFTPEQLAQAWLQLAQIELAKNPVEKNQFLAATQALAESKRLCAAPCDLRWVQQNVAGQLAALQQDWQQLAALSADLLQQAPATERAEIAHAYRLQAQAQLALQQHAVALKSIDMALDLDRQLARPDWLLADYRLRLQIVRAAQDVGQIKSTEQKIASLCAGLQCNQ